MRVTVRVRVAVMVRVRTDSAERECHLRRLPRPGPLGDARFCRGAQPCVYGGGGRRGWSRRGGLYPGP